jgi:hypothetical protein
MVRGFFGEFRMGEESENAEPVVNRNQNYAVARQIFAIEDGL